MSIHEALYEVSFVNLLMYGSTVPSYKGGKKDKKGNSSNNEATGKTENFSGFSAFLQRMKEIKKEME